MQPDPHRQNSSVLEAQLSEADSICSEKACDVPGSATTLDVLATYSTNQCHDSLKS